MTILLGDSAELLRTLESESCHSLVTDPPAGISFMSKGWDDDKGGRDQWIAWLAGILSEAKRVLKPGAHGLVWAIPRTSHWTGMACELAGFEVRDTIAHMFGSGFPKSHNLDGEWDGWGTALKPAREDWILVRKPFKGTVAGNVQKHGCGALNVDGCRVGDADARSSTGVRGMPGWGLGQGVVAGSTCGRWPANVVLGCACEHEHDPDCAVAVLDAQSGTSSCGSGSGSGSGGIWSPSTGEPAGPQHGDTGGASRFYYVAKASREERERGLAHRIRRNVNDGRATSIDNAYQRGDTQRANIHPTVKNVALMRWLTRLVTPPGGHVLDVFAGSGTTGMACEYEGFEFTGIEADAEHCEIARARIAQAREDAGRMTAEEAERKAAETGGAVQLGLLDE